MEGRVSALQEVGMSQGLSEDMALGVGSGKARERLKTGVPGGAARQDPEPLPPSTCRHSPLVLAQGGPWGSTWGSVWRGQEVVPHT